MSLAQRLHIPHLAGPILDAGRPELLPLVQVRHRQLIHRLHLHGISEGDHVKRPRPEDPRPLGGLVVGFHDGRLRHLGWQRPRSVPGHVAAQDADAPHRPVDARFA